MENRQYNNYEKGIDVSKWQGDIEWCEVLKSEIQHAFIRMSEGATYTDPKFFVNWKMAKELGIKVGAYHYFRGLSSTPAEQLENIKKNLSSVQFNRDTDLLAIDVEKRGNEAVNPEIMADNLHELLQQINYRLLPNFEVIVYCSPGYWDSSVAWEKYDFSRYPLWVAHWNAKEPRLPKSWARKTWVWWQHSSKGRIQGIRGNVDLDWINIS